MDLIAAPGPGGVELATPDQEPVTVDWAALAGWVRDRAATDVRWVWPDTAAIYPRLLRAGVRVERAYDLRLAHTIVARSTYRREPLTSADDPRWAPTAGLEDDEGEPSLLDRPADGSEIDLTEARAELARQQHAVDTATEPSRLRLLLAAESVGALIAAELNHVGLPFDPDAHDARLTALLGPRPRHGGRPARLEALAGQIRLALAAPGLNPDSPSELLRALRAYGLTAESTRQWELERIDDPVIEPLLAYKKLARLLSANGWAWLDDWVTNGRFRPDYVPAGVVTGRWATRGGGALQLPKQIRAAVIADPGCRLVVADAAQLEPRVLAAMAGDEAMARASRAGDLYQALVDAGVVDTRAHAKVAMLGALYGATSGEAGLLMPRLVRTYPAATARVEQAARAGERGEVVTTWLGRSSPPPPDSWRDEQRRAGMPEATAVEQRRARSAARDWGRFTRNFIVQGTAAEWALCWMANLRRSLLALDPVDGRRPELVYFLHDEVIVETPAARADAVADAVRTAARRAGELLFGRSPVEFALEVSVVNRYDQA